MLGTYINSKATHTPTYPSLKYGQLMFAPFPLNLFYKLSNKELNTYRHNSDSFVRYGLFLCKDMSYRADDAGVLLLLISAWDLRSSESLSDTGLQDGTDVLTRFISNKPLLQEMFFGQKRQPHWSRMNEKTMIYLHSMTTCSRSAIPRYCVAPTWTMRH